MSRKGKFAEARRIWKTKYRKRDPKKGVLDYEEETLKQQISDL